MREDELCPADKPEESRVCPATERCSPDEWCDDYEEPCDLVTPFTAEQCENCGGTVQECLPRDSEEPMGDGWVKLVEDGVYGGTFQNSYTTLAAGSFTELKAVWKSGAIQCNTGHAGLAINNFQFQWIANITKSVQIRMF